MDDKLNTILSHFGFDNQVWKLLEEVDELKKAVDDYVSNKGDILSVMKEVVDVSIVSRQLIKHEREYNNYDVSLLFDEKLDRTLEIITRMNETGKPYEEIRKKY